MKLRALGLAVVNAAIVTLVGWQAYAAPVCNTTTPIVSGDSFAITSSVFATGNCLVANDKEIGNWAGLSGLPAGTLVEFGFPSTDTGIYTISFNGSFLSGTVYTGFGYDVAVTVSPNTITAEAGDFTQTLGGPSTLDQTNSPGGSLMCSRNANTGTGNCPILFNFGNPGVTDLTVSNTLTDMGTITAVSNAIFENISVTVPEPASLGLLGVSLIGLGFRTIRRRKS